MLEIKKLNSGYKDLRILHDVSLSLPVGKISVLLGPNGAGKSTLIKSVYNLADVRSGEILFEGQNITRCPAHRLIRMGINYVPQGKINFSELSVRDNLLLGGHHVKDKNTVKKQMEKVYDKFPILKEKERQKAFSLSGGQQQMLALGRAMISRPKLLLLDEPSLGLSPKLVKEVFNTIKTINEEFGATILVVEHNIKSFLDIAHHGYVLIEGRLMADQDCASLKTSEIMKKVFMGQLE
ncbi:MAG: ABC transporter ATP-binding protein [Candidatus Magasanikbacteria bacterium CG10_big_fil_rev_8_21_14_0_10_40_10]|uniref:ABC transporter ATP-binding protein n=1 Tax=Candidatus Magasanikbacteria bacterium CG10_big_fil_rev_8_21_14_0_10_40_10 TaxID=1974648 RepID=A0A2M6W3D5_9BACT|nr:MAG: ABC transporter ATP-binding protein [Candidatus Magasanikbacteria bacterium CG10_big_fil_rev_8_21_14_0_10_40_10]